MADDSEKVILSFGTDFTQADAEVAQKLQQYQAQINISGGGPATNQIIGGNPLLGGGGFGGLGATSATQQVQMAGQQLAAAVQQATQSVRAAASGRRNTDFGRPLQPGETRLDRRDLNEWARMHLEAQDGPQNDVEAIAAARDELAVGGPAGAGGRRRGGGSRANPRFGSGLSQFRGYFYSLGAYEAAHAWRGVNLARAQAQYAENPIEALDAEISAVDASTSGVYGGLLGMVTDLSSEAPSWMGYVSPLIGASQTFMPVGPSGIKKMAMEAKARSRATGKLAQARTLTSQMDNSILGGPGKYGKGIAGIANTYLGEELDIGLEAADASASNDPYIRTTRLAAVAIRRSVASAQRGYARGQLNQDLADEVAGYGDQAMVAAGGLTHGQAARAAMVRRFARSTTAEDRQRDSAELGAFDAEEGYRVWGREYAAGSEAQQAGLRYRRQPNVARAVGMYTSGVLAMENARREGSPGEANSIGARTAYELAGFRRELVERGSGTEENLMNLDFGQLGASGRRSMKEGDDIPEAIKQLTSELKDFKQFVMDNL